MHRALEHGVEVLSHVRRSTGGASVGLVVEGHVGILGRRERGERIRFSGFGGREKIMPAWRGVYVT
jgi:hypothetical protein